MDTLIDAPIIAGLFERSESHFAGILSLSHERPAYWLALCKAGAANLLLASRMLALLRLHRTNPLLHPVLVPTSRAPATALFFENGEWGDHRNLSFPDSVRAEVDRIASVLRRDHKAYLSDFVLALSGTRPPTFGRVPRSLPIHDQNDQYSLVSTPPMVPIDDKALGKWGTPEFFGELTTVDYRRDRYLSGQPEALLDQRAIDAVINVFEIEGDRELAVNLADLSALNAISRLGEVMEEIKLRRGGLPSGWLETLAAKWGGPGGTPTRTRKALESIASRQGRYSDSVAKFGNFAHLREALERGNFLITPASKYADQSLNRAQTADELVFEHHLDMRQTRVELFDEENVNKIADLTPSSATVTRRAGTDAYVFCTSRRVSARLFHDFAADGCLLIHDRKTFMRRLAHSTRAYFPEWTILSFDVRYLDPFAPESSRARPLFDKPAGYEYQCEHRVIWLPPTAKHDLERVSIEIGPLIDVAELIFIGEP